MIVPPAAEMRAVSRTCRRRTARLIEGPNDGYWFWNSDDKGNDPTPWFSLQLEHRSVVHSLYIR
jgi:hypothetical protein